MKPTQQVGLFGAIAIGLASMLGAGVFVVFREAFDLAANWLWLALLIAAATAALNAASIYQLARQVDRPGGVYAYARVYRTEKLARTAGLAFILGKIASIAAIALVFGSYVLPEYKTQVGAAAIAVLAIINILGIQRTALIAAILAGTTVSFLVFTIVISGFHPYAIDLVAPASMSEDPKILAAAAIFFFAFAGYARVATLGTEVRDAKRNIPKAIAISLALVLLIYVGLANVLAPILPATVIADSMPFVAHFSAMGLPLGWLVIAVAALASLGSMLALLAGVSRTAAEMAKDGAITARFAKRNRFGSPWMAEIFIALIAGVLVFSGPISWVISLSSLGVLFYYAVGHLSALAQPDEERIMPKFVPLIGLALCLILASSAGLLFAEGLQPR